MEAGPSGLAFFYARTRTSSCRTLAARPDLVDGRARRTAKAQHSPRHTRHDTRRSDGLSRIDARADALARRAGARVDRLHARLRAGADHDGLARDDPDGYVSARPPRQRLRCATARPGAVSPGSAAPG